MGQERFNRPLWHDVDELAGYIEQVFETLRTMREVIPTQQHSRANKTVTVVVAFLVIFTAASALLCVLCTALPITA